MRSGVYFLLFLLPCTLFEVACFFPKLKANPKSPASTASNNSPTTSPTANLNFSYSSVTSRWIANNGDVFVADTSNFKIRKINRSTGIITTVAGTGVSGCSGIGGPATAAKLYFPWSLVVDSNENIYYTDLFNNIIGRIDGTTGILTIIAGDPTCAGTAGNTGDGGLATAALIRGPYGITFDSTGNLYFTQTGATDNTVRKINMTTGIITTVAGSAGAHGYSGDLGLATAAKLWAPQMLTFDTAGNMFIAEGSNNVIRKVDASTGIITTVAGNGTFGSAGDGGPALAAQLYEPTDLVFDSAGNLLISDGVNSAIRKWNTTTLTLTTIAGTLGVAGYVADGGAATAVKFQNQGAIALDPTNGNLMIADSYNSYFRTMNLTSGNIFYFAGTPTVAGSIGDGGPATAAEFNTPFEYTQ